MGTSLGARRPRLEGPVRSATIAGDSLDPIAYSHSRHYAPTTSTYSPVQRSGHPFDQPMPLFQGESSTLPYHSPGLAGADGRRVIELEHSRRPPLNLEHETQIDMPSGIRRNDGVSPEHKRPRIGSNIGSTIDGQRPDLSNSTQHPGLDPRDEDKEGPKRRRRSSVGGSYGRGSKHV